MSHPFGDLLSQFLHRKHGLSQFKLAGGILQSPSVISEMCNGKRLTGPQARERVVAIISWLHQQDALITQEEANILLEAAGMSPLREREPIEADLLHKLSTSSLQEPQRSGDIAATELPASRFDEKRSTTPSCNNLPSQRSSLIGREDEIDEIIGLLNKPDCRLLTLSGQGGIGKTQLAIQVAHQVIHNFPDGIFFTPLQSVSEPALLAQAILDAMGMPVFGTDEPGKRLIQFLREKKICLLLDNFDELLQTSAENTASSIDYLAEIIEQAPWVKLLVTSRQVLNLSGEWIYPVQGLSYPKFSPDEARAALPIAEDVGRYSAIQLFVERARRVQPNLSAQGQLPGIVQICQVVEGLPLALEMAAAWTKMMSCAAIAAEIQRSLTFLETRYQDIPPRHRNILAVIDQSWQALSLEERRGYARLSVFKGGFQRQAAEQVAGASLSILTALVDKSLLRWELEDRYQIHELLRQYAWDRLIADPDAARAACDMHCMVYADFLYQCSGNITGPRQQDVLRDITAEIQNIRAAWQQAVDNANLPALKKAAYTYYLFCDFTGRYLEGAKAFELAAARLMKDDQVSPQAAEVLSLLQPLLGYHYIRLGQYESAKKAFLAGQEIFKTYRLEISPGFGTDPLTGLSLLALVNGDYPTSIQYARAGREASLQRDDPLNLQIACYVLSNAAFATGEYQLALAHVQEGLLSTGFTGNRWMKAQLLSVHGQIAQAQNQYALAQQKYQESYRIKQELNDPEGEADALNHMAMINLLQGKPEEAYQRYRKSLDIYLRIDDPGGLGSTYAGLGDSALAKADYSTARHYYRQGLQLAIRIQWLPLTISLLTGISNLLLHAGRAKESAAVLNQILSHPAIKEDARIRAWQSLERISPHLLSQDGAPTFAEQIDEDLFHVSRALLAELEREESLNEFQQESEKSSPSPDLIDPLTPREFEVLLLIAQGKTNQQIADRLVLSVGTVKWYSRQIGLKLGVANRTQAVARAHELHLLD